MKDGAKRGLSLSVDRLVRDYGQGPVLADLDFGLEAGGTLAVIGPSGCGKSTLMSLLAGLDRPDAGSVRYGREGGPETVSAVEAARAGRIAYILQDYGLFPWKTVEENLALPLSLRGVPRAERRRRCAAMLEDLALSGLGGRYPVQLSGGQRQRVAIGRALITGPDVLLMDEPFSSLDALTREHLQNTVLDMWRRLRPTCVLVTHSVAEAVYLGRRVMVLAGRPARIVLRRDNPAFGSPSGLDDGPRLELMRDIRSALGEAAGPDEEEPRSCPEASW